jgi:hypothetical protein
MIKETEMTETKKTLQRWHQVQEMLYIEKAEGNDYGDWVAYDDAAALITENEQLRAEIARLREALRAVACDCELDSDGRRSCVAENPCAGECPHLTARNALEDEQ